MFKIYIASVAIWFIINMCTIILFDKKFQEAIDAIKKATNNSDSPMGYPKTFLMYLCVCCIPIFRVIFYLMKLYIVFCPDEVIDLLKKNEKDEEKKKNGK